ncbi:alanine racemase [Candidatus Colwellia aromaticivorans]|uniref:alanine racemase n=1 Tax=Candidatus Colwellia aromaticivorans TaxID=2267621 RepID=UPI000DF43B5D|nr:alanine racemase [Candidatus Colwellia aromaticivorans]
MSYRSRKTQAIINLSALKNNYNEIANLAPISKTIAVIKANAYGHGAIEIAKSLHCMVPAFAVAFIDEAIVLRTAGITLPILILEGPLEQEDFALAKRHNFWLMLHNTEQISWLNKVQPIYKEKLWIKVDTGMNRLGFTPEAAKKVINDLTSEQKEELILCSHFSNANEINNPKTQVQITCLKALAEKYSCQFSLANSAGIINWPQSHADFNRLGIALYGTNPTTNKNMPIKLTPVMTLQSTVIALRKVKLGESVGYGETWQAKRASVIATIAIGYADGYPRNAQAGTPVFINNQLAPLAGQVSMDMITVDVTNLANIALGDVVELWGENLNVEVVAKHTNTINYELLTRVSARVPKVYIDR